MNSTVKQNSTHAFRSDVLRGYLLLFLLWPFGALIKSLQHFRSPVTKLIFWLFCVYFGFVFAFPGGGGATADSARYAQKLTFMHNHPSSFSELISSIYNPEKEIVDVYDPLATWLVAFFTGDPRILFALVAAVFGYFYMQNLWMIFDKINIKVGFVLFLFMLAFAFANPIWNINGVRWYTAAQVFVFGALRYFLYGEKKDLAWSVSSIFIHFSFLFPVILLFTYLLIPKRITVFFIFFIGASFISEINLFALKENLSFLPEIYQTRVDIYLNESAIPNYVPGSNIDNYSWYIKYMFLFWRWIIYLWIVFVFIWRKRWLINVPKGSKLYSFALFFAGWAQIAGLVPSGDRFMTISDCLFYAIFILIIVQNYKDKKLKTLTYITSPFLLFVLFIMIRGALDYIGFMLVLGNPFTAIFIKIQTPLIDFIKGLL